MICRGTSQFAHAPRADAIVWIVEAEQLFDSLARPDTRLQRWELRARRPVGSTELRAMAHRMMADFEELLAQPALDIEVTVREAESTETTPAEQEGSELTMLLQLLRRARRHITSSRLRRVLQAREPELSKTYEAALARVLEHINEIEKVLVLYGAGTDEDAELASDVIPSARDDLTGPSVPFEF